MLQKKIIIHGRLIINVKIGKRILFGWTMNDSDIIGPFIMVILQEFILKKNLIATVPHPIRGNRKGTHPIRGNRKGSPSDYSFSTHVNTKHSL